MSNTNTETLEPFRRYLEVLARMHLDGKLRGKLDPAVTLMSDSPILCEVRDRVMEISARFDHDL